MREDLATHGRRYAERASELRNAVERARSWPARAGMLVQYGDACRFAGRIAESQEAFTRLLEEAAERKAFAARCEARIGLGNAACARSRWDDAVRELSEAIEDARAASDHALGARARSVLASAHFNRGELETAGALLREALQTAREYELVAIEVPALISFGVLALSQGELDEAFARLTEGALLAERAGDAHWAAVGRSYLAIQAHLSGRSSAADAMYDASLEELDRLGIRRAGGLARLAKATLRMSQGRWEEAREILEVEAVAALAATCPDYESTLQAALAIAELATGNVPAYRHRVAYARTLLERDPQDARAPIVERVARIDREHRGGDPLEPRSIELVLIDRACEALGGLAFGSSLVIDREAKLFRVPGSTSRVDLSRRLPLRRLLKCLVDRHVARAGDYVGDDALIAYVWPGERIVPAAAAKRLHVAMSTLRAFGLRPWIERAEGGYRLRPDLVVRVVDDGADELSGDV